MFDSVCCLLLCLCSQNNFKYLHFFLIHSKKKLKKYLHNKYVGDFIFSLHQLNWFFNELLRIERINTVCINSLPCWVTQVADGFYSIQNVVYNAFKLKSADIVSAPLNPGWTSLGVLFLPLPTKSFSLTCLPSHTDTDKTNTFQFTENSNI